MRGKILTGPHAGMPGVISGEDGQRYRFAETGGRGTVVRPGQEVDFEALAGEAREVRPASGAVPFFTPAVADALKRHDWVTFYLNPQGRVGRRDYWLLGFLVILVINLLLGMIPLLGKVLTLVTGWCGIALMIKRCHDVGRSGWWSLLPAAPALPFIVGVMIWAASGGGGGGLAIAVLSGLAMTGLYVWFIVTILARPGDAGPNRFGPPPPALVP